MNEEKKKKKKKKKRQKIIMIKFFIHIVPLRSKASTRKYKGYLCLLKEFCLIIATALIIYP